MKDLEKVKESLESLQNGIFHSTEAVEDVIDQALVDLEAAIKVIKGK